MSELRIPPGFFNAIFKFSIAGDSEEMSWALAWDTPDPVADADGLAELVSINFSEAAGYGSGHWYSQWVHTGVHVVVGNDGPPIVGTYIASVAGTGGSNATLPQNCALICKKTTGFGGRKYRGRFYMPPISLAEADVNNVGMIDSGVVTAVQGYVDAWLADTLSALGAAQGTTALHLLHSSANPDPTPVTNVQVENQIATQRRRLR
jgi:hypothetical protein